MTTNEEELLLKYHPYLRPMFDRLDAFDRFRETMEHELAGTDKAVAVLNDRLSRVERREYEVVADDGTVIRRAEHSFQEDFEADEAAEVVGLTGTDALIRKAQSEHNPPRGHASIGMTTDEQTKWEAETTAAPRCGHGYSTFVRGGKVLHTGTGGVCAGASIDPKLVEPEKRDHPFVPGGNFPSNCGHDMAPSGHPPVICGWDAQNHTSVSEAEYERRLRHWASNRLWVDESVVEEMIMALKAAPGFPVTGRKNS